MKVLLTEGVHSDTAMRMEVIDVVGTTHIFEIQLEEDESKVHCFIRLLERLKEHGLG